MGKKGREVNVMGTRGETTPVQVVASNQPIYLEGPALTEAAFIITKE